MATPSNKTSSSSPIASKPNPNLRNSEVVNPIRRSFTGNPFAKPSIIANPRSFVPNTPANSPSENPRRNSMGRATTVTFSDSEDKENGKDSNWKAIRVRSPSGSKGAKNFMSPTISASYKFTPSPRKKILAERNEPVRASSVDLKSPSFDQTMEDSESIEVGLTPPMVFKTPKTGKDLDSNEGLEPVCGNAAEEPDSVNLDPSFKISPPASCWGPVIVPLDADPSAPPPYDPKTNYLSPRPQFLHYRPNPRIEHYLSKEKEGKRLEDGFLSGSFSDTEATEETQSEDSLKELEDVTSDVTEGEQQPQEENGVEDEQQLDEENEEEEEVEEEVHMSDPIPISHTSTFMSKEEAAEVKGYSKPRFFWRSKFTALLVLLAVGLLLVSVVKSPVIENYGIKDLSFLKEYEQSQVAEYARASFDGLARNIQVWSANSVYFISEFIFYMRGARDLGPLHYCNLTALVENVRVDGFSVFDQSNKGMEGMYEFDVFGHTTESVIDFEDSEEKHQLEIGATENIVEVNVDPEYEEQVDEEAEAPVDIEAYIKALEEMDQPEIGAAENIVQVVPVDPEYEEQVEKENVSVDRIDSEPESIVSSMKEETVLVSQDEKVQTEVSGVHEELQAESEMSTGAEVGFPKDHSHENAQTSEEVGLTADETQSIFSMVNVLGITSLISALIGSTAFIYAKKRKNSASSSSISAVQLQPLLTKKLDTSPNVPISNENTFQQRDSSWNWIGEPCSSEMSSVEKSSSHRTRVLKPSNEAESQERRPRKNNRRESLASIDSSMDSPSYGSFTTYEKIPIKHHGYGEEDVVTPVRRSSRIWKQVTSP